MEGILFHSDPTHLRPELLDGFFEGWPNPPSTETHLRILSRCWAVELACDSDSGRVVGFVNAISDGFYAAYIPLLEVLPDYRGRGIGRELIRRIMERCAAFYMVDVCCDDAISPFYERFGMVPVQGMCIRNFDRQSGAVD